MVDKKHYKRARADAYFNEDKRSARALVRSKGDNISTSQWQARKIESIWSSSKFMVTHDFCTTDDTGA
ncbi:hypothetical protein MPTK1_1g29310 [Marchantia polymorpha subsp. ruderalis]|uniref:Uncharacterized protein n=2 Tax=Marchantia polymorpha TaxID=3197 RepID=A0AAF6AVI0_MARPO|nr:hypothetical protein MARPO_0107s0046 [Marchantia polymorpha]BBN00451.1 hypothetical protein Mp_1g29310 [Marchantia polymorpha subsp. ruderalis]|eukprot:PTQ31779.1 hypothetical protein MARPO_0107s0046 [Marchantia polymorpha]